MPRKYNPVVKTEYEHWCDSAFHSAEMQKDKNGQWVPLKVFEDEYARLNAMILKLKKQLNEKFDT
jgi:hypothetical protein